MKLHLGCGDKILEGFTNIDIRNNKGIDIIDDISKLTKIKNNSVSLIYASHVLEHFKRKEYMEVLKRWYEILRLGGKIRISVPDFEKVCIKYKEGSDLKTLLGLLYGGQTYKYNYHYMGFDFKTLKDDLMDIGFKNINRWDWHTTDHNHIDDYSQCYLPHMDKKNGTLMSLNMEAEK